MRLGPGQEAEKGPLALRVPTAQFGQDGQRKWMKGVARGEDVGRRKTIAKAQLLNDLILSLGPTVDRGQHCRVGTPGSPEHAGDKLKHLRRGVCERQVFETALDLRPLPPLRQRRAGGILLESEVLKGDNEDPRPRGTTGALDYLLEDEQVGIGRSVGKELKVFAELVYQEQNRRNR